MDNIARRFTDEEIIRIYNEDYVGKHMGIPSLKKEYKYDFYDKFRQLGLTIRTNQEKNRKYYCDSDFFEIIDSEEKAYWLGFLYADGYISRPSANTSGILRVGISLKDDDANHLEKFVKALNSNAPVCHYEVKQGYKPGVMYCRVILADNKLAHDLISHGCIEKKSNIIEPPIGVPEELERHFIRGFMDGNGSITKNNNKYPKDGYSYTIKWTSTDAVLLWIMRHLIKNNILQHEYPLYKRKQEHIVSGFEFGGNKLTKKYLDYIYKDATVWLNRKHDRYIELLDYFQKCEDNKMPHKCDICGNTEDTHYSIWRKDGEYKNKVVCNKHYHQLRTYNRIIPDKKNYCDLCGDTIGALIRVGKTYPNYFGMTLCKKHYTQLTMGHIPDKIRGEHKNA